MNRRFTIKLLIITALLILLIYSITLLRSQFIRSEHAFIDCNLIEVTTNLEGEVLSIVEVGSFVKEGDAIATIDQSQYDQKIKLAQERGLALYNELGTGRQRLIKAIDDYPQSAAELEGVVAAFEKQDEEIVKAIEKYSVTQAKNLVELRSLELNTTPTPAEQARMNAARDTAEKSASAIEKMQEKRGEIRSNRKDAELARDNRKVIDEAIANLTSQELEKISEVNKLRATIAKYKTLQAGNGLVYAPADGVIVNKIASKGEQIKDQQSIVSILTPELQNVWIIAFFPSKGASRITPGDDCNISFSANDHNYELNGVVANLEINTGEGAPALQNTFRINITPEDFQSIVANNQLGIFSPKLPANIEVLP